MNRRTILKYAAMATGAGIGAPFASAFLTGCAAEEVGQSSDYVPSFFDESSFTLIKSVIDIILPKTDSPSASEVGVHKMIDSMVGTVYPSDHQEAYRKGFEVLTAFFQKGDLATQIGQLESGAEDANESLKSAYIQLKQQAISYYLTSEEIGTQFLNYLPVPGEYQGCISLEEAGGKAWAE